MDTIQQRSVSILQRLGRNLTILFSGTVATTLLGLATLALNTRALGPIQFGILMLIQSSVVVLSRLFSFDTWQGLIKFGAESDARNDLRGLAAVSSFAIVFDALTAFAAGACGLLILFLFGDTLGLSADYTAAAAVYIASLFVHLPGAPIGLLRLFDKFDWSTAVVIGEAALRCSVSAIFFLVDAPLSAYLYAFAAILAFASLLRVGLALKLLRSATRGLAFSTPKELRTVSRRFVRFSVGSWITGTLNVTRRDGTMLIVAALLGPAAAGVYAVAQRMVRPVRDVAELLRQAIFPDLSRLVADSQHQSVLTLVRQVLLYTAPLAVLATVGGIAFGRPAIALVAGHAYLDAYWPLVFLILAASFYLCMPLLSSLAILYVGMRKYTIAAVAAAAVWALLFIPPMLAWGIDAAGVGELVYVIAWIGANTLLLARVHKPQQK